MFKNILNQFSSSPSNIVDENSLTIIREFSRNITLSDFDEGFLKPEPFFELCKKLSLPPEIIKDKYYLFTLSEFPQNIYEYRKRNKFSQKHAAKLVGISPIDINKFERGLKFPSRSQYEKLTTFLNN